MNFAQKEVLIRGLFKNETPTRSSRGPAEPSLCPPSTGPTLLVKYTDQDLDLVPTPAWVFFAMLLF